MGQASTIGLDIAKHQRECPQLSWCESSRLSDLTRRGSEGVGSGCRFARVRRRDGFTRVTATSEAVSRYAVRQSGDEAERQKAP